MKVPMLVAPFLWLRGALFHSHLICFLNMSEIGFRPTSAIDEMATKPLHKYFDVAFFNTAVGLRQFFIMEFRAVERNNDIVPHLKILDFEWSQIACSQKRRQDRPLIHEY